MAAAPMVSPEARSVPVPTLTARRSPRRPARLLAVVVAVAAVIGLAGYGVRGSFGALDAGRAGIADSADAPATLAVLPFVNVGADPGNEYFSDGLTEDILNALGRLEGLQVAARTSAFAFKGSTAGVREIGRRLGAAHILEGSVRRADDRLRVTAQLIDVETGFEVWSGTFDRQVEDVFTIQQEISRSIVAALHPRLVRGTDARLLDPPTHDVDAYNLFLRGRHHFNRRSLNDALMAVGYFKEAIARDSSFALAHAGLADVYALLPYYRAARPLEALARAETAATRAIALDSTLAEPHATLAWVSFTYRWDWPAADREFEEALRLNPNHTQALHFYSLYLARVQGRHDRATELAARAQRLDPLAPVAHTGAGAVFYHARQYARAIAAHQHALALDSTYSVARYMLAEPYLATGRPDDALRELERVAQGSAPSGDRIAALRGYAYAMLDRRDDAHRILERAKRENVSPVVIAMIHTRLGERDSAFVWLERAANERDPAMVELQQEPLLDALRTDARFNQLAKRIGLP